MESRQKLYKTAGQSSNKLTQRVLSKRQDQKGKRNAAFNSHRNINSSDLDNSPMPARADQNKMPSRAVDRDERLKSYRLQRNTDHLKKLQKQKVPFFNVVPSGVWLDKTDNAPRRALSTVNLAQSPVRQILMKPRAVRRSTLNKVLQHSAKKVSKPKSRIVAAKVTRETKVFNFGASPSPVKKVVAPQEDIDMPETPASHRAGPSSGLFRIEERESEGAQTSQTETESEQTDANTQDESEITDDESEPETQSSPETISSPETQSPLETQSSAAETEEKTVLANALTRENLKAADQLEEETSEMDSSNSTFVVGRNSLENSFTILAPSTAAAGRVERESAPPEMFSDYKNRISMRVESLLAMMEQVECGELSDNQKLKLEQTKFLVKEAGKRYHSFLRQYETAGKSKNRDSISIMTEDDIDNYWYLFCEEVETLKKTITEIESSDANLSQKRGGRRKKKQETNSERKRQSMRLINTGTPKRHNPSCFGCESASKLGTPKSASRKSGKKSIVLANNSTSGTPDVVSRRMSRKLF